MAVQKCGTKNIFEVHKLLPHKTITELRDAFETYSRLAANRNSDPPKTLEAEEESSLKKWIELISKVHKEDSSTVLDIVPRVLKYIALFEVRDYDHTVCLKDCYLALSELCKGQLCTSLNYGSSEFLYEHLQQLALKIKREDTSDMKSFIQNITLDPLMKKEVKTYGKKKKSSKTLNPLKVPDNLTISKEER